MLCDGARRVLAAGLVGIDDLLALVLLLITFGCVSGIRFAQRRSEIKT